MTHRIHNFGAGPCTLPLSVLQQAQAELLDFQGCGMSVMEISHRSKLFEPLHEETLALAAELLAMPEDFQCLLLPGGAHQQFCMIPLNLLTQGETAAYLDTGVWGKKAYDEAARIAQADIIWSGKESHYTSLPSDNHLRLDKPYRYLYLTSNETVNGIQFRQLPSADAPLVIDASSDYYSRPINWQHCDIVYGGVQKNLAPSGLGLVFVRKTLLQEHSHINKFFSYQAHAKENSLYNTPPTWQIYMLNLVLKWMKAKGGVAHFAAQAAAKSAALYQAIDNSNFYRNDIAAEFRSQMNVVFKTPNEELDTLFWKTADKQGLHGLKGHRIVGGLRASLYNALEMSSVAALIDYMQDFANQHG